MCCLHPLRARSVASAVVEDGTVNRGSKMGTLSPRWIKPLSGAAKRGQILNFVGLAGEIGCNMTFNAKRG